MTEKEKWVHPDVGQLVKCLLGRSDGTLGADQWHEIGTVVTEPTYWNEHGSASVEVLLPNGSVTQIHCGRLEIIQ